MYRTSLSVLALGFFLAVLASALPAANNKRQGGFEDMIDKPFHMANEFMTDSAFTTGGGVGQNTLITPTVSGSSTPASASASASSSSTPLRSVAASPTHASSVHHGSPAPAGSTPSRSTYSAAPSSSTQPEGKKEKSSVFDLLKPLAKLFHPGQ